MNRFKRNGRTYWKLDFSRSSNLDVGVYDPNKRELWIQFHSGGTYLYERVPPQMVRQLESAPSIGGYHHDWIKWDKPYTKVAANLHALG